MTLKILNLYAGIGGNRKLWSGDIEVTAIEYNKDIAAIYQEFFPNDRVIITDAHQYLLEHYSEYDFIWSSPPCPTHSRMRNLKNNCEEVEKKYPDMKLYEEIIFLKHFFKGKWVVENVISYYEPLIKPYKLDNHYFWSNFVIPIAKAKESRVIRGDKIKNSDFDFTDKEHLYPARFIRKIINNTVKAETGLKILNYAYNYKQEVLI